VLFFIPEAGMDEQRIRDQLLVSDPDFRRLFEEHQRHESRLAELAAKPFLSPEESVQERELKKHKLALKDKMAIMISAFGKNP
jgi:uncharacterized protein YdcH (DUF465 family)